MTAALFTTRDQTYMADSESCWWFFRFLFCCVESCHFCLDSTGCWNTLREAPAFSRTNLFPLKISFFWNVSMEIICIWYIYGALPCLYQEEANVHVRLMKYAACCWLMSRPTPLLFLMDVILCVSTGPVRAGFHLVQHTIFLLFFLCPLLPNASL